MTKVVAQLMSSSFYGGPERQILGMARHLNTPFRDVSLLFNEKGRQRATIEQHRRYGLETIELVANTPHYLAAVSEVAGQLRRLGARVLVTHGYKPDLIGWRAARRAGIPVIAVAHGW